MRLGSNPAWELQWNRLDTPKGGKSVDVPILVEPVANNGFRATGAGGISVGLMAEGATAEEAIDRLAQQVQTRLRAGAQLTRLTVAGGVAPWKQDAGYLSDDPLYDAWRQAMEDNRRKLDEDPDAL
jgi:hypothetical protein